MNTPHACTLRIQRHAELNSASCFSPFLSLRKGALMLAAASLGATYMGGALAAPLSGAIYTSTKDGTNVNANIYMSKADVYLNGGPQNANAAGLPFNDPQGEAYYFQVTDPSGQTLLSEDDAVCRQVLVAPSPVSGKGVLYGNAPVPDTCTPHALGDFSAANGSIPVQLLPYQDTPNNGGEYKLWLIRKTASTSIDPNDSKILLFSSSDTKTDNFKVRSKTQPPEPVYSIEGTKFYDTDADGMRDDGEPGIFNYKIELFGADASNTTTALVPLGMYSFGGLKAAAYGVCEVIPEGGQKWYSTTAVEISPIQVGPDSSGNDFGNVCIAGGNGRTLGFWSNKNGQSLVSGTSTALPGLKGLHLRSANGKDYDPASAADLSKWLLSANATNMANMLSAQMAAMWLNVNVGGSDGKVPDTAAVYAGVSPVGCPVEGLGANGFINVVSLIAAADASLTDNGNTVASGPLRSCQEFMKNALDNGNNNRNFVGSPQQCEVVYSGMEASCSPPSP